MSFDPPAPREGQRERYCVLMIYGVPVLLALISVSGWFLAEYVRMTPAFVIRYQPLIDVTNLFLAGLAAGLGAALRKSSVAGRVAGGFLFGVVGAALYIVSFALLAIGSELIS